MKNLRDYILAVELAESQVPERDQGGYNDESGMVMGNLNTIMSACEKLLRTINENENLPEWVQAKVTMAKQNITSVAEYMSSQHAQGKVYDQERE